VELTTPSPKHLVPYKLLQSASCLDKFFDRVQLWAIVNIVMNFRFHISQRTCSAYECSKVYIKSPGSSISIVSNYGLDDWGFNPQQGQRIFLFASVSRLALRPTQPPIQWVLGVPSLGVKSSCGMMLTTHPHLVPRSITSWSYSSCPPNHLHGV
jgi:hypothetical protein